jgi:hypothetical protein
MGNCVTTLQLAQAGTVPQEVAHQLTRSGDGKIRFDAGNISVISDPASQRTILLDHLNKEAKTLSTAATAQVPGVQMPGMPQFTPPGLPAGVLAAPPASIQDLGKRLIEGEEAEGKRITFEPPKLPAMPNIPTAQGMPRLPQPPAMPTVAELWTNPNLHLPVMTQVKGDFGQQICKCKNKPIAEPDPSLFQIPKDYKDLTPAPSLPGIPHK